MVLILGLVLMFMVVVLWMEFVKVCMIVVGEFGFVVVDWVDGEDFYVLVVEVVGVVLCVGVFDVFFVLYVIFFGRCFGVNFELVILVFCEGWMIKDVEEIVEFCKVGEVIDVVYCCVLMWFCVGCIECEVVVDIVEVIVVEGYCMVEFVIVGLGLNGVDLYYEVFDCLIEEGDVVVVDIGGVVFSGYNFDSIRIYVVGIFDLVVV